MCYDNHDPWHHWKPRWLIARLTRRISRSREIAVLLLCFMKSETDGLEQFFYRGLILRWREFIRTQCRTGVTAVVFLPNFFRGLGHLGNLVQRWTETSSSKCKQKKVQWWSFRFHPTKSLEMSNNIPIWAAPCYHSRHRLDTTHGRISSTTETTWKCRRYTTFSSELWKAIFHGEDHRKCASWLDEQSTFEWSLNLDCTELYSAAFKVGVVRFSANIEICWYLLKMSTEEEKKLKLNYIEAPYFLKFQ